MSLPGRSHERTASRAHHHRGCSFLTIDTVGGHDADQRVLVIGLDPFRVPGPWAPEPVAERIATGIRQFAEHGVGVETCLFGLDGTDDITAVVTQALRSNVWECVVVGGGVRTGDEQIELFEQVINLVRRYAPDAAIAFNSTPEDTYAAAARWIVAPSRHNCGE